VIELENEVKELKNNAKGLENKVKALQTVIAELQRKKRAIQDVSSDTAPPTKRRK
jgi:prefoldin subunit 5